MSLFLIFIFFACLYIESLFRRSIRNVLFYYNILPYICQIRPKSLIVKGKQQGILRTAIDDIASSFTTPETFFV
jgi:hypothetical protein